VSIDGLYFLFYYVHCCLPEDFSLASRRSLGLCPTAKLRGLSWQLDTDLWGQIIGTIFKGRLGNLDPWTWDTFKVPKHRQPAANLRQATSQ